MSLVSTGPTRIWRATTGPWSSRRGPPGPVATPARPYKPRDKAKVEAAVLVAQRVILAALRNRTFFDLASLNAAIRERLEALNNRPIKSLGLSRRELFERLDRPALKPLPADRYELSEWK